MWGAFKMNTRKGYQMLVVVLFFAFISLISRSIVYLVLSIAIATIIVFLLSSNKKKMKGAAAVSHPVEIQGKNKLQGILLFVAAVGLLLTGYGVLYFTENPFFRGVPLPKESYIAVLIILGGFLIVLISLYLVIKRYLAVGANIEANEEIIYCGNCRQKNDRHHTYCSKCGKKLS